ncbi:Semaphorin-6B [Liparis tanakae]|uniref:Semaphorin-6B n=1 Tax=Liparis tanakae TaxID=230148 RepID=A0A4Z2HU68_9TELE|nr:Semaphorin-6B [Liparis tanakae]
MQPWEAERDQRGDRYCRNNTAMADLQMSRFTALPSAQMQLMLRDDLFRVELDIVGGDEMFYSKKRTWESNKNDIRICRMKGKHESSWHITATCQSAGECGGVDGEEKGVTQVVKQSAVHGLKVKLRTTDEKQMQNVEPPQF